MLSRTYEDRLIAWKNLRSRLDYEEDPVQCAIDFWKPIPEVSRSIDPYDAKTWPDPWEMIEENSFCEYTKVLAIGYTLMLTEKCKDWHYEIQIGLDRNHSKLYYILLAGDHVVGIEEEKSIHISKLPKNIHIQQTHVLSEQF